ncbi:MAG: Uma2 family endonuclease [Spirulina sp.]
MYDLPSEDPEEFGLPDEFHDFQPDLLKKTCQSPRYLREEYFIASDLNLYYDREHPQWYKRPDWFLVLGARPSRNQQELRLSYVIWQEQVNPFLVVELASPGTENEDLGRKERKEETRPTKWEVYEEILQVPYYVVYDRYANQFLGFALRSGKYEALELPEGRLWLEELELGLGLWQGNYEEVEGLWLRFYDRRGNWIPTPEERAELEEQEKERERQEKERERQRAILAEDDRDREKQRADRAESDLQKLRERLLQLGIDPDRLP